MRDIIAKMIEELPNNGSEILEISTEVDISFIHNCLTFTKDRYIFDDAIVLSLRDILTVLSVIYTDNELLQIKSDSMYDEDDKIQNALLEEFDRILNEGVRYEFN